MRLSRFFRFAMLAAAGGMLFQATGSCTSQLIQTFATTFVQAASSAVLSSITSAIQSGTTT